MLYNFQTHTALSIFSQTVPPISAYPFLIQIAFLHHHYLNSALFSFAQIVPKYCCNILCIYLPIHIVFHIQHRPTHRELYMIQKTNDSLFHYAHTLYFATNVLVEQLRYNYLNQPLSGSYFVLTFFCYRH